MFSSASIQKGKKSSISTYNQEQTRVMGEGQEQWQNPNIDAKIRWRKVDCPSLASAGDSGIVCVGLSTTPTQGGAEPRTPNPMARKRCRHRCRARSPSGSAWMT